MAQTLTRGRLPIATIVMYHIVHGRGGHSLFSRLKGLDVSAFAEQLAYIRRHYSPVGIRDLADADITDLPPKPIVLSFDDGYAVHYTTVFPLLAEAHVPAVFFPVTASLLDRTVLDVNKIQCVLAAEHPDRLVEKIDDVIERERASLAAPADFRQRYWKPSRWDAPEIVYVKRMLQHGLPERVRRPLVDRLFASLVTNDERAFADELYMNVGQARDMMKAGMTIGAHGGRHIRLTTLTRAGQSDEIDDALRVLDATGSGRTRFAYSYANGEHNDDSVALLRARGCAVAVSTRPDVSPLETADLFALPRIDANDLPARADAAPNDWTMRADNETAS